MPATPSDKFCCRATTDGRVEHRLQLVEAQGAGIRHAVAVHHRGQVPSEHRGSGHMYVPQPLPHGFYCQKHSGRGRSGPRPHSCGSKTEPYDSPTSHSPSAVSSSKISGKQLPRHSKPTPKMPVGWTVLCPGTMLTCERGTVLFDRAVLHHCPVLCRIGAHAGCHQVLVAFASRV